LNLTAPRRLTQSARAESRRRRIAWAALAALLVIGPMAFNLARESRFTASVEIFPSALSPYPPIVDPGYYRSFLRDPELRRQMRLNAHAGGGELAGAAFRAEPAHNLLLTVAADDPARAQELVNTLAPQISEATRRWVARQAVMDIGRLDARLRSKVLGGPERRRLARRIRRLRALGLEPPSRVVLGPSAPRPRLDNWADKLADALPGSYPAPADASSAGLGGLMIVAALWLVGLAVRPPARPSTVGLSDDRVPPGRLAAPVWSPRLPRVVPWLVLAATGIALVVIVVVVGRKLSTFRLDDWAFVLDRQGNSVDDFLRPHNEHLSLWVVIMFKALLATVGMGSYWPYRLVIALVTVSIGGLVYLYAKPRLGRGWALAPAVLSMLIGHGGYGVVWPVQLGFDLAAACGVGVLLCFDRRSARSDLVAGLLLFIALCGSSLGIAVAAVAAVDVLLSPRQRTKRALRILAVPLIAYGVWWLHYHPTSQAGPASPLEAVRLLVEVGGSAVAGLFATPLALRSLLAVGLLLAVAVTLARRDSGRRALVIACVLPGAYWVLLILGRGSTGSQLLDSRYILPGSIFVACILSEVLRGWTARARPWMAAVVALGVLGAVANDVRIVQGIADYETAVRGENLRAELAALSLAGQAVKVEPSFLPASTEAPTIQAGRYFRATAKFGDPVPHPETVITESSPRARLAADMTYLRAARVYPLRTGKPPAALRTACSITTASSNELTLPSRGLAVLASRESPVPISVRRWGPASVAAGEAGPHQWVRVGSGSDKANTPIRVQIRAAGVRVCPIPR
jgi:hypothetical protein